MTKLFSVIVVVVDEVCDLAEGLVCDNVLEWHDDDGLILMWMT